MITVKISSSQEKVGIEATGHALFAPKGQDLVCCAVSTLIQNWILSSENILKKTMNIQKDNGYFFTETTIGTKEEKILLESMILGISVLAKKNPGHIKITMEESENG